MQSGRIINREMTTNREIFCLIFFFNTNIIRTVILSHSTTTNWPCVQSQWPSGTQFFFYEKNWELFSQMLLLFVISENFQWEICNIWIIFQFFAIFINLATSPLCCLLGQLECFSRWLFSQLVTSQYFYIVFITGRKQCFT